MTPDTTPDYQAQCARDARDIGYGGSRYWDYLERTSLESQAHYLRRGDPERAAAMLARSLSEALRGNDGD